MKTFLLSFLYRVLSSIEFHVSLRPLFRIEHFFYFHPFAYTYVRRGGTHIPPTSSSPSPSFCQVDIRVDSEKCSSSSFLFFRPDVLPQKRTEYVWKKREYEFFHFCTYLTMPWSRLPKERERDAGESPYHVSVCLLLSISGVVSRSHAHGRKKRRKNVMMRRGGVFYTNSRI